MSEPHDVVKLLVARMESNPEEFNDDDGRWAQWLDELLPFVTDEERVMLRKPMMQTIHEEVLDELMNGLEKRREAEENRKEYERHLAAVMQHTKQQQALQQIAQQGGMVQGLQNAVGQYQQAIGQMAGSIYGNGGGGGGGASLPVSTSPYSGTITGTKANSIMIDDQVLDGPMIKKIKRMLSGRRK